MKFIVFQDGKKIGFILSDSLTNAFDLATQKRTGKLLVIDSNFSTYKTN